MERIFTDAVIYKVSKYTDSSVIASAYTVDYGKVKLFIPKAYSKKGGIHSLIPGELDFLKKTTSDLNKFYTFRPYTDYMSYTSNPYISLRLSLFFDIFDNLYGIDEKDTVIWKIITSCLKQDISKVSVFGIYALLKNTGHMFSVFKCSSCNADINDKGILSSGVYLCPNCKQNDGIETSASTNLILKALHQPALYKNLKISLYQELEITNLFVKHIEFILNRSLKSYTMFNEMLKSL